MQINKDTMQATKITFKKMAVEYQDNAEMFTAIDVVVAAP